MERVRALHEGNAAGYRNVIVATDLGPGSESLLATARKVAPSARITAVHAYEVPHETLLLRAGVAADAIQRQRGERLRQAVERIEEMALRTEGPDHRILALSERGHPVRVVGDAARSLRADLLVVAPRRRGALGRLLAPSISRQIVANAECDVLVARELPEGAPAS